MSTLIFFDSLVFVVGLIAGGFVLYLQTRRSFFLFLFGLLYLLGTYSSYNIMVKPIHDYNRVIARTFFYHQKVLGPLAVVDLLVLILLVTCVVLIGVRRPVPFLPKIFRPVLARDLLIAFISLIMFSTLRMETGSSFTRELIAFRGLPAYLLLFLLIGCFTKNITGYGFTHVFKTFVYLDVINLASGLASALIYRSYVWERYGFKITIIDQDDAYSITIVYALLLVYAVTTGRTVYPSLFYHFALTFFSVLVVINFYKLNFALGFFFLLFTAALSFKARTHKPLLRFIAIFSVLPLVLYGVAYFGFFGNTTPIDTRLGQLTDLLTAMQEHGEAYLFAGLGSGTFYQRTSNTGDGGEIKALDLDRNPNVISSFQVPIFNVFKVAGLLGLTLHLVLSAVSVWVLFKAFPSRGPFTVVALFFISYKIFDSTLFLTPSIFTAFAITKLYLLLRLTHLEPTWPTRPPTSPSTPAFSANR